MVKLYPNVCHSWRSGPAGFAVEQVAKAELERDGDSTRGQAQRWARRRLRPRVSSALGKTEIVPEGEPNVGQGRVLRPRASLLFRRIRCPIGGMAGGVRAQWRVRNHVVASGRDCCLVATVLLCPCVG